MRLIDADALGIGKARRDAFLIPEYADGWNSAIEHIENAPTVDIKTEVAKEIFAEIEDTLANKVSNGIQKRNQDWWLVIHIINKLKNKYTKEGVK